MSNINLKRFVDINIRKQISSYVDGTRQTTVLFTNEGESNELRTLTSYAEASARYIKVSGDDNTVEAANTLEFAKVYFDNGGVKLQVHEGVEISDLADKIAALDDEYICVAYASDESSVENVYSQMKSIAKTRSLNSNIYGINEKILLATTLTNDNESVKNFAVKYSTVQGAEMTIAAYLSKLNAYGTDSIYDYAFTQEVLASENISDSTFGTIQTNNMNVVVYLANFNRNCGGNMKDGSDVTNTFVRIVLHQTLTDRLINLLTQKIKNASGLSKIYTVIAQELDRYLVSGYLTTDKIWLDETLNVEYNGATYPIIEKGTPITSGYVVRVLPLNSLSEADRALHKAPPIHLVIADQYGIRQITINGDVI